MLSKLALRNARRSSRDYVIYLITVILAIALVYSFNTLIFSEEIQALSSGLGILGAVIIFISCIVVFVIGWLIFYMMRFMLERRSKEFGTYMLLGISNRDIVRLYRRESLLMGGAAFAGGVLFGTLIYQFLALLVMKVFGVHYQIRFTFSPKALGLSLLYFGLIYLLALVKIGHRLKKMKICDLLYAEKKNESEALENKKGHWGIFILSVLLLIGGCVCLELCAYSNVIMESGQAGTFLFAGIIMLIISIYGIYLTVTAFITKAILTNPTVKYQGNRLFLTRNLSAKLRKTGAALGTLALLLTLTLTAVQLGVLFKQFFDTRTLQIATFDVGISLTGENKDFGEIRKVIDEDAKVKASHIYPLYTSEGTALYDYFKKLGNHGWMIQDAVLAYSDYVKLCEMLDLTPAALEEGHYLLYSFGSMKEGQSTEDLPKLEISGTALACQDWKTDSFGIGNGLNGTGYTTVVEDKLARTLDIYHTTLAAETDKKPSEGLEEKLEDLFFDQGISFGFNEGDLDCLYTRTSIENNNLSSFIIFSFSLFYVGLIFACVAATILAVQQLSESSKYRFRYRILSKLGVGKRTRQKLVFKNVLFYFAIPLAVPIPLSMFVTRCMNHLILMEQLSGGKFWGTVFMSIGVFGFVYLLYFAATYIGCRKNI